MLSDIWPIKQRFAISLLISAIRGRNFNLMPEIVGVRLIVFDEPPTNLPKWSVLNKNWASRLCSGTLYIVDTLGTW